MTHAEVCARWLEIKKVLVQFGGKRSVRMVDRFLTDLAELGEGNSTDLVTLVGASALCGYSTRHLARLIRGGVIPNYGRPNAPRVRPADLPVKPSSLRVSAESGTLETARGRIAKSVINL